VAAIGAAIASALAEAHRVGIVHRDVKPANILISDRGVPKLADFGIARAAMEPGLTATGLLVGTPAYVAPELALGSAADTRSDVWSLGMTLYAALDGRAAFGPFADEEALAVLHRIVTKAVPPPAHPGPVADVILRMLAAAPEQRPSADDVTMMLRDLAGDSARKPPAAAVTQRLRPSEPERQGEPTPPGGFTPPPGPGFAPPPPSPSPPPRRARRGRAVAAVAAALAIAAAAVITAALVLSGGSTPGKGQSSATSTAAVLAKYRAPGGLVCRAAPGWQRDTSSGAGDVRDYVAPGQDYATGTYMRFGRSGRHSDTVEQARDNYVKFLNGPGSPFRDVHIVSADRTSYQGTPAGDVEFTGVRKATGLPRHGRNRVWISDGVTRAFQLNTAADAWVRDEHLFDEIAATCTWR
jgi:hypothetical protein